MSDRMKMGEKTITGHLHEDPIEQTSRNGNSYTRMRILENQRVFDRAQQQWVDGETVGYDVYMFNERLREHALAGLSRGDKVTVRGNYEVSSYKHRKTDETGLNHRILASDVYISMFDDRFDPSVASEREASVVTAADRSIGHGVEQEQDWPPGFTAQRAPLDGPGVPPAPGPPPAGPTLAQRELQELAQRKRRITEQQASGITSEHLMMQQYNTLPMRPGTQGPGL